jgi:hypothetical protein
MDNAGKRTCMPIVAGILDIVIGSLILIMLFIFGIGPTIGEPIGAGLFRFNLSVLFLVIPGIIISALDIIGGVFAVRRRRWGWALAGSITAAIGPTPLGIVAIVLIVLSRNEFKVSYNQNTS